MSTKRKVAAVLITTVALSAGTVGVASADSKSKNRQVSAQGVKGFRGDITAFLASLVAKGTITQAQADAIIAAANAAKSAADAMRPTKPDQAAQLALIASTIGIDTAFLISEISFKPSALIATAPPASAASAIYDIKPRLANGLPGAAWQETIKPFRNRSNAAPVKSWLLFSTLLHFRAY